MERDYSKVSFFSRGGVSHMLSYFLLQKAFSNREHDQGYRLRVLGYWDYVEHLTYGV